MNEGQGSRECVYTLFLFFISKVTLSVEHNFTEEMEEKQNTVMFK